MHRFTFPELADIHLVYGMAEGNTREAQRIYRQRYPDRHVPHHATFMQVDLRLRESGSFSLRKQDTGRIRTRRTVEFEEEVLQRFETDPSTSTRVVGQELEAPHSVVWQVVKEQQLYPYHPQRVLAITPADYRPRMEFSTWFLQQTNQRPEFPSIILFTDEATFTREGIYNYRNSHIWDEENPHVLVSHGHQQQFRVNVWAGILENKIIGPYLLPPHLNGVLYRRFLADVLPELLEDVPLDLRRQMFLQLDGAPAHFARPVRDFLNDTFGDQWIGRGGPIPWPPRSPDLTPIDFFLWGRVKNLVYQSPIDSEEELVARIIAACGSIGESPFIFDRVRQSLIRRCELCIDVRGGQFEHIL